MKITEQNIQSIYTKYGVSEARAQHSLGVARIAVDLAKINNVDPEKAWLAGALHDLARDWDLNKKEKYTKNHNIIFSNEEKRFPYLTHGKIAADIAKEELDISEDDILLAIATHTSGEAKMSTLQSIIYASDYIDSTKDRLELQSIHRKVFEDLNIGINQINRDTLKYLQESKRTPTLAFLRNLKHYSKYI